MGGELSSPAGLTIGGYRFEPSFSGDVWRATDAPCAIQAWKKRKGWGFTVGMADWEGAFATPQDACAAAVARVRLVPDWRGIRPEASVATFTGFRTVAGTVLAVFRYAEPIHSETVEGWWFSRIGFELPRRACEMRLDALREDHRQHEQTSRALAEWPAEGRVAA